MHSCNRQGWNVETKSKEELARLLQWPLIKNLGTQECLPNCAGAGTRRVSDLGRHVYISITKSIGDREANPSKSRRIIITGRLLRTTVRCQELNVWIVRRNHNIAKKGKVYPYCGITCAVEAGALGEAKKNANCLTMTWYRRKTGTGRTQYGDDWHLSRGDVGRGFQTRICVQEGVCSGCSLCVFEGIQWSATGHGVHIQRLGSSSLQVRGRR